MKEGTLPLPLPPSSLSSPLSASLSSQSDGRSAAEILECTDLILMQERRSENQSGTSMVAGVFSFPPPLLGAPSALPGSLG